MPPEEANKELFHQESSSASVEAPQAPESIEEILEGFANEAREELKQDSSAEVSIAEAYSAGSGREVAALAENAGHEIEQAVEEEQQDVNKEQNLKKDRKFIEIDPIKEDEQPTVADIPIAEVLPEKFQLESPAEAHDAPMLHDEQKGVPVGVGDASKKVESSDEQAILARRDAARLARERVEDLMYDLEKLEEGTNEYAQKEEELERAQEEFKLVENATTEAPQGTKESAADDAHSRSEEIWREVLRLRELKNQTPEGSPDYESLEEDLTLMEEVWFQAYIRELQNGTGDDSDRESEESSREHGDRHENSKRQGDEELRVADNKDNSDLGEASSQLTEEQPNSLIEAKMLVGSYNEEKARVESKGREKDKDEGGLHEERESRDPREAAPELLENQRNAYVEAMQGLDDWFSGKAENSPFKPNVAKRAASAIGEALAIGGQSRARKAADDDIRQVVGFMKKYESHDAKSVMEGFYGLQSDPSMGERIAEAAQAKYDYDMNCAALYKRRVAELGAKRDVKNRVEDENDERAAFMEFVVKEYELQQQYRQEQLGESQGAFSSAIAKVGEMVGAYHKAVKSPWARLGISALVGGAVTVGVSAFLLPLTPVGTMGAFGAMVAARYLRGATGYLGGKTGARAIEKLAFWKAGVSGAKDNEDFRKWHQIRLANEISNELRLEREDDESQDEFDERKAINELEILEDAMQAVVRARKYEAQVRTMKNIVGVMAGIAAGASWTAVVEPHLGLGTMTSTGTRVHETTVSPRNAELTASADAEVSLGHSSSGVDNIGSFPQSSSESFASNAERLEAGAGFRAGSNGSIWEGVREQVKHYVITDPAASPDTIGVRLSQEQFDALRKDLLDGAELSKESKQALDRIVATSITRNNLMTMGIRNPDEIVLWKPNGDGGSITFGNGDKAGAVYEMGGKRPVALGNVPQDRISSADAVTKVGGIEYAEPVGQAVEQTGPVLTSEQIAATDEVVARMREAGIDIVSKDGIGMMNLRNLLENLPQGAPAGTRLTMYMEGGATRTFVLDENVLRLRDQLERLAPTDQELDRTFGEALRARIASGQLKINFAKPVASENVTGLTDVRQQVATQVVDGVSQAPKAPQTGFPTESTHETVAPAQLQDIRPVRPVQAPPGATPLPTPPTANQ